ncbi:hypothetical protein ACFLX4_00305 [Chloroflexota bacterium]
MNIRILETVKMPGNHKCRRVGKVSLHKAIVITIVTPKIAGHTAQWNLLIKKNLGLFVTRS